MKVRFNMRLTAGQNLGMQLLSKPSSSCKFIIFAWSRQSGKSTFAEMACIKSLCKKGKFSAYICPTYKLAQKVYNELTKLLHGTGIISKANASDLRIESVFGTTLQFFSGEAPTAIRGNTVSDYLIIDEAAYFPDTLPNGEDIWYNVIYPIAKVKCEKVIMISTPAGKRGFFYEYYMRGLAKEKGYVSVMRDIYKDRLASPEFIEEIKRVMPEKAFRQEYLCEFLDSSLTFFDGFEKCFSSFDYNYESNQAIGIDLSGNGSDETVMTFINDEMQVRQLKIKGSLDMKYSRIADEINNCRNLKSVYVEVNGLGAPMFNDIQKLVHRKSLLHEWVTTNSTKEEILSDLAVQVARGDIHFSGDDDELFSQFGTFICRFTKTRKLQLQAMGGAHDDRIMSLGIALRAKKEAKKNGDRQYAAVLRF